MKDAAPQSLASQLLERVARTPNATAFMVPAEGRWQSVPWADLLVRVRAIACGLRACGLADEARCGIVGGTRLEWVLADWGCLCAGGATTTVYPSSSADECAYILQDSNSRIVFVEDDVQAEKLRACRAALPAVGLVVRLDGGAGSDDGWIVPLAELEARGRAADAAEPGAFARRCAAIRRDRLATLIYTSGTTGRPKGVELTHDNWLYEAEGIDRLELLGADDLQLLWLPLAHAFGKVLQVAQVRIGFCTAIDGRVERLVDNLAAVRPTFVAAVPRVFEKVRARLLGTAAAGGPLRRRIFDWAMAVGHAAAALQREGRALPWRLRWQHALAQRLVFAKLQARFGGRLRFFISGAAPLAQPLAEFFHAAGVTICEGYGLTETTAGSFFNLPDAPRFGTVGPPLPGTEVRLQAEDGEVLIRGRGVMRGYHGQPALTAEVLDADGWLRTGDIGSLVGGALKITDRKKDLIKTSNGKYVAPQDIEGRLKLLCPQISQVLVHGNNRNFCVALVALDLEGMREAAKDAAAAATGGADDYGRLAEQPRIRALVDDAVKRLNSQLAPHESIRKFVVLPRDMSVEGGELTPSLKLKRKAVEQQYRGLLDGLYASS